MGAILYAIEAPPFGGDTCFANQYLAYDALSVGMKRMHQVAIPPPRTMATIEENIQWAKAPNR